MGLDRSFVMNHVSQALEGRNSTTGHSKVGDRLSIQYYAPSGLEGPTMILLMGQDPSPCCCALSGLFRSSCPRLVVAHPFNLITRQVGMQS